MQKEYIVLLHLDYDDDCWQSSSPNYHHAPFDYLSRFAPTTATTWAVCLRAYYFISLKLHISQA